VVTFLLGWCVVSIFGTLLALRLIRSGKRSHHERRGDTDPHAEIRLPDSTPGQSPLATQLPELHSGPHRTER
jgi:hypothetical protein